MGSVYQLLGAPLKRTLLIASLLSCSALCLFIGYSYSNSTKEDEILRAIHEEASRNYEISIHSQLNTSNIVYSMVKNIKANNYAEFHRRSCLYLIIHLPTLEKIVKNESLPDIRREQITNQINGIKEYVNEGESNKSCDFKPIEDKST